MKKFIYWSGWSSGKYWGFWVRVFGCGVSICNTPPMFSERLGYRRTIRIFGIKFELLDRRKA